jgi:hypothetical protein
MRPVVKSTRLNAAKAPLEINPWRDAKKDLTDEVGTFCSFCGKYNSRSALHVEHIFGKKCKNAAGTLIYDHLKYRWDNFLLACVNCNSIKDNKDIAVSNPFMPHKNNLLHFIEVIAGGLVRIKEGVNGVNRTRTEAFINLVGIDRVPGHPNYSDLDDRWDNRLAAFDIAQRQLQKYINPNPETDLETIVDLSRRYGYFSVWYSIFIGYDTVIDALINGTVILGVLVKPFPGTHTASFNAANHYSTLPRP